MFWSIILWGTSLVEPLEGFLSFPACLVLYSFSQMCNCIIVPFNVQNKSNQFKSTWRLFCSNVLQFWSRISPEETSDWGKDTNLPQFAAVWDDEESEVGCMSDGLTVLIDELIVWRRPFTRRMFFLVWRMLAKYWVTVRSQPQTKTMKSIWGYSLQERMFEELTGFRACLSLRCYTHRRTDLLVTGRESASGFTVIISGLRSWRWKEKVK